MNSVVTQLLLSIESPRGGIYGAFYSLLQTLSLNYITAGLRVHLCDVGFRSSNEDTSGQIPLNLTWRREKHPQGHSACSSAPLDTLDAPTPAH